MKVLFVNNKDSFVYILVEYVARKGPRVVVVDNSASLDEIERISPDRIIISPGPGHPAKSTGNVIPMIKKFHDTPILGVCLGHQAIVEAFGGKIGKAKVGPQHGKLSTIKHDGKSIFAGVKNPFKATRYHSLAALPIATRSALEVSAVANDGTIMGVRHRSFPIEGVQFHPESIMTRVGDAIVKNFLAI